MFPVIRTLDDILVATHDRDEILVADRGTHTVVNYLVVKPDTFPPLGSLGVDPRNGNDIAALRRECRGLLFSPNGNIIKRSLHKFFNINEKEETLASNIDLSQSHDILTKLDGSSIGFCRINNQLLATTRMGPTEIANQSLEFVKDKSNYINFINHWIDLSFTPIFEWISRKQRIVIDYPDDNLVLLGLRHWHSGEYLPYS